MISISKNEHIHKLDDLIDKYNNTHHKTIKANFTDVNWSTYFEFEVECNDKDPKLKLLIM